MEKNNPLNRTIKLKTLKYLMSQNFFVSEIR